MPDPQFLGIFLIALVAGIILFRLYSVLGRRTGHEPPPQPERYRMGGNAPSDAPATVTALPSSTRTDQPAAARPTDPVARGLLDIKLADRNFEPDHFVQGARGAYETIVTAFARGDRTALKPLLSDEVYAAFDQVITARSGHGETVDFTFVGFKDAKVIHAALKGRTAEVTVTFAAQFISATKDKSGAVIEGDDKAVRDVTDVWTYARDTRARDPNWTLIATSGELP
jgi:predicted lipid-binding transport protein (Tim44 family)